MSVVRDILAMYRAPRDVAAHRVGGARREDRALAYLVAACVLIFVSQWPRLAREAALQPDIDLQARLAGALFAWVMVMPLAFYIFAFVLFMILRLFDQGVNAYHVRAALFWALLASVPLWLLSGLTAGFVGMGAAYTIISTLCLAAIVVFARAGLRLGAPNEAGA